MKGATIFLTTTNNIGQHVRIKSIMFSLSTLPVLRVSFRCNIFVYINHHCPPSKSKVKLSHNTMAVLCQQPAHHDEVIQWFHNIDVLAAERHSRGHMKVRSSSIYVLETKPHFYEEYCARTPHSIESCDIKTRWPCLFYHQGDRSKRRDKDQELIISRTLTFDDTLLDKYAKKQE